MKIGQSCHKMYSNNILNFRESTTNFNACTKHSGKLLNAPRTTKQDDNKYISIYIYIYIYVCVCVCVCVREREIKTRKQKGINK